MSVQLYYAVDASSLHAAMLAKSIESLRRHSPTVSVRVHVYASPEESIRVAASLAHFDVDVRREEPASVHPTQLKWRALGKQDAGTVVFLDADTYFHRPIEDLLDVHHAHDFYAREEVGTEAHGKRYLLPRALIQPQLDRALFAKLAGALGSRADVVYNTGVMIFGGSHRRIVEVMEKYLDVFAARFRSGDYAYPSTNEHIVEEIAAALVLGLVPGLACGTLSPSMAPFFVEGIVGKVIVEHAWTAYYPFMLAEIEGVEAARALPGAERYAL